MLEQERQRGVRGEVAVMARVVLGPRRPDEDDPLDELAGLAATSGTQVRGGLVQYRDRPDPATLLGRGKVEELRALVEAQRADLVLFDNDLSPAQTRNLERALGVRVLDRTELILDIFATHARTPEAKLAVELAQLEYALPRLKRMWTHLSRLKMGVGMRGPGEKQLEVDRRLVVKRIHELRSRLKVVEGRKERAVRGRREHRTVSLVGYTNAGKSTLMNRLTGAGVVAEDRLFATLDTRTRRWQLPGWGPVLLSDTVGFIRDLPHRLIASFKATLEEARSADLLLHVADASHPRVLAQIEAAGEVLREIGIDEKDTLLVLNKIDRLPDRSVLEPIWARFPNAVSLSAATGEGIDRLAQSVSDLLSRSFELVDVEMDIGNGRLLAYLAEHGEVLSRKFDATRMVVRCRVPRRFLGRIHDPDAQIRPVEPPQRSARRA